VPDQQIGWNPARRFSTASKFPSDVISHQSDEHLFKVLMNDRSRPRSQFGLAVAPVPVDVFEDGKAEPGDPVEPLRRGRKAGPNRAKHVVYSAGE